MRAWHGLRVAFAVGSVFTILLIVYWDQVGVGFNLYPLQDPKRDSMHDPFGSSYPLPWAKTVEEEEEERQKERKRRIFDVCTAMGNESVQFPGKSLTFKQIHNHELDHLIVDDDHRIIYCNVPKIACSNWKRVMLVLAGSLNPLSGKPFTDPSSIPIELVHNPARLHSFAKSGRGGESRHLMELKLEHYTKFLFVREPFVRLMSAFRDKFGLDKFGRPNPSFYQSYATVMMRRYGNVSGRLPAAAEAFAAGINPSFLHFIKFILDPQTENGVDFNEHWLQVYRLCHPCQIQYDFIGRLENLETDSEQLLKLLGLNHLFGLPSGQKNATADSWMADWFATIPVPMRKELYKLHEPDFELFGYPKPDSVLHQ